MNIAMRQPRMTREQLFTWAEAQDRRTAFDPPIAQKGGASLTVLDATVGRPVPENRTRLP